MKKLYAVCLYFLLMGGLLSAQKVNFYINAEDIGMDEVLTYTVELSDLRGGRVPQPEYPNIKGFAFGGTMTSNRNINGQISVSLSANYYPQRTGTFTIPSVRYRLNGKTYDSPKFRVRVKKSSGKPKNTQPKSGNRFPFDDFFSNRQPQRRSPQATPLPDSLLQDIDLSKVNEDYFLTYHLSQKDAFIGEQIKGEVLMYVKEEIDQQIRVQMDAIFEMQQRLKNQGFFQEIVDVRRFYPKRVIIDGQVYVATVLYKVFLFPIKTGTIDLDDIYLEADYYEDNSNSSGFGSILGRRPKSKRVKIRGQQSSIKVSPLPKGGPVGANMVGIFDMGAEISAKSINTGEALQLKVTIQGTGHPTMMSPPILKAPESFRAEEPSSDFTTKVSDNAFIGEKSFTYVLTPTQAGDFDLGPFKFYFYNSRKLAYDSLSLENIPVKVSGATIVLDNGEGNSLRNFYQSSLEGSSTELDQSGSKGSPLIFVAMILLVGAGIVLHYKRSQPKEEESPKEYDPFA